MFYYRAQASPELTMLLPQPPELLVLQACASSSGLLVLPVCLVLLQNLGPFSLISSLSRLLCFLVVLMLAAS